MFTGLIQEVGSVRRIARRGGYRLLEVSYDESRGVLRPGDSMAANGVCLTASSLGKGFFGADLSAETQRISTLGSLKQGDPVNLERPVTATDPLGGHVVLGHVDGIGRIRKVVPSTGGLIITIQAPAEVMDLLVTKGSVAVDGVSLTVGAFARETFDVFLIPETQTRTTLSDKRVGAAVNLESDYLAKLVKKFVGARDEKNIRLFPGVRGED
jgi:riboflavin synthase